MGAYFLLEMQHYLVACLLYRLQKLLEYESMRPDKYNRTNILLRLLALKWDPSFPRARFLEAGPLMHCVMWNRSENNLRIPDKPPRIRCLVQHSGWRFSARRESGLQTGRTGRQKLAISRILASHGRLDHLPAEEREYRKSAAYRMLRVRA